MSEMATATAPAAGATPSSGRATEPLLRLLDNPILIGQARRRLRQRQVLPSLLIPALAGLCGVLLVTQQRRDIDGAWANLGLAAIIYMGLVLFLRGTIQVAGSLAEERRSGILDFHRATPTTPWTDALGYLLGAPAREYLVAAVGLPFAIVSSVMAGPKLPLGGVVLFMGVMLLSSFLYHTLATVIGLSVSSKRGVTGVALLAVVALLWTGVGLHKLGFVTLSYLTPFPAAYRLLELNDHELSQSVAFFGITLHPLLFTVLVQGSVLGFLFLGATRKLRREGATTFSRLGGGAFFALLIFLSFAGSWPWITGVDKTAEELHNAGGAGLLATAYVYASVLVASVLMVGLSPSYLEYVRAQRRARRRGQHEARWLDDGGAAWPLAALFGGLVLIGLSTLVVGLGSRVSTAALLSQHTAICVLACLSFLSLVSGATEYVKLSQRGSALGWGMLIVFVLMILPWVLAGIASAGGANQDTTMLVGALSPTFGLGTATLQMAETWAGDKPFSMHLPTGALGMSIALTMGIAGAFLYKVRSLQTRLAATMPLGDPKHAP